LGLEAILEQAREQTAQMAVQAAQAEQHLLDLFLRPMAELLAAEEQQVRRCQEMAGLEDFKEMLDQQHQLWLAQELGEFPQL